MKTAIAVILFLNGVQIPLPSPAILQDELTWVPVRAVFQELDYEVGWDASAQAVKLSGQGRADVHLWIGETKVEQGKQIWQLVAAPRRIMGTIYVPAQLLRLVARAQLKWDNDTKALYITAPPVGKPAMVNISEILSNPPGWANKLVTVTGEYTGWQPDPFSLATAGGPPVTRSDWTLRDATGSVYCTGGEPGAPLSLQPYSDLGRRLEVTGAVQLAKRGFPYLQVQHIEPLTGLKGVTCYLATDRRQYQSGDTVVMQMKVGNPNKEPIMLQFTSSKTYDFAVYDRAGPEVWRWSQGKVFTQALQQKVLAPQESYLVEARWTVPVDDSEGAVAPGLYKVKGQITREIGSYPHVIQIQGQQ